MNTNTVPSDWINSCDFCTHQEGRHYCLLHEVAMKNMDSVRCDNHSDLLTGKIKDLEAQRDWRTKALKDAHDERGRLRAKIHDLKKQIKRMN